MTKSEQPEPSQHLQPIYLWKWYISLKMSKSERTSATLATLATNLSLKMIYIFSLKMTKSQHPQPSQPLQPIYLWKWYVSLKKWQSLNIPNPRNPRNLFIFENDIYLWKYYKVWTPATLATYLSLKMISIFKKMKNSEHLQPSQPIYLWKWYTSLKMTKSEHPQNSRPLQLLYLWKWYISLKMTKSEHPQPSQPLQPIYFWKWYVSLKKLQSLNNRNPRNPCNLFIFENDIYL